MMSPSNMKLKGRDRTLLELFCEQAFRMNDRLGENPRPLNHIPSYDYGKGLPLTVRHVERYLEGMAPVLFPLRQFISKKDALYFPAVCAASLRYMTDAEKRALRLRLTAFEARMCSSGALQVDIDGEKVKPDDLTWLLLYSSSFHADIGKRRKLQGLLKHPWSIMLFVIFEEAVIRLNAVTFTSALLVNARLLSSPKVALPGMPVDS